VEDDGPGIAIEDRAKVFNSFTQLKQSNSQKGRFGLGLAIVKRIAEWHQGSVIIEESVLGGARFVFRWPLLSNGVKR
jgi:signal transduction histidine kinase